MTVFRCLAVVLALLAAVRADDVNFNRDVRPILSEHCFACHGFDAKQRKADLRLDVAEGAFAPRKDVVVIKPKDPAGSELWLRINSEDPTEVMPPPETKKPLTAKQKELLRKWIEQGAVYQKHWAFEAPVKPAEPVVQDTGWIKNPIDRFILARLQKQGLSPRPEADKPTLIRRAAFALTGLPPTPGEVDQFEADASPEAYERMVDRYLQSPRYGEEMARHWLDVARYADTHGLHLDNERTMWAYRDWVVQAFNSGKKFDAFTIEQLAGDLLPQPTLEQLVATGFNRCNVTTSEGGAIEAEFLYRYAVDRASTTTQAWMGLTGGCAVCHDHKFDPLTTKEFYSLYAFFYSAADPAMDRNTNATDPFLKLAGPEQQVKLAKAQADETEAKRLLDEAAAAVTYSDPADQQPAPQKQAVEEFWLDDVFPAGARVTCNSRNASIWVTEPELKPALGRRALKQASPSKYEDKFENPTQPLIIPDEPKVSIFVRTDVDEPPLTLMLEWTSSRGQRRAVWGDPKHVGGEKSNSNWMGELPVAGAWSLLELPVEKLDLKPGDSISVLSLTQFGGIAWWDGLKVSGTVNPATDVRSSFSAWWKDRTGKDTPGIPGELASVLKEGPDKKPAPDIQDKLRRYYLANIARPVDAELLARRQAWIDARVARTILEDSIPGTFIFKDLDKPREAFVMLRGQYDKPGEKVEPGVPAVFPPLKAAGVRATRLDLAHWLLSPENPLTARVTVNRFWQQLFGTGLVKTSFDFGSQGEAPSHPELLDWLAVTYREQGWDTRALVRLLVTSATFRQESNVSPELLRIDPDNRLYARGPRFRLDAEQIRDNALFVSGLINFEMGGRGVKSYQPPNIWEPVGYSDSNTRFYQQDHGPALYRRSLYNFLKRTAPPPFMSNFDAPNREQFCTRRERSNTPLQALQLLNDVQHFESARALGERILTSGGATPQERITFAYRVVLSRRPQAEELAIVAQALDQYLARYAGDAEAARRVVAVGESKRRSAVPDAELAAYTLLANLLLNLDETVMRN